MKKAPAKSKIFFQHFLFLLSRASCMRLFLAVDIPEELRDELRPVLYQLKQPGLKPVAPEHLHVTLKFLGDVENPKDIEQRLESLAYSPFSARSTHISCFGYRVLWLGLESPEMAGLARELDTLLPEFESEYARFTPHLTLARAKDEKDERVRGVFHHWLQKPLHYEWTIDRVVLYASTLSPKGPKYERLREYNLSL